MPLGEILFFRGLFVSVAFLVLVSGAHRQAALLWNWPVFWRTIAEIFAAFLYLFALFHIPIANANAILQIVPLMITAARRDLPRREGRLAAMDGDRRSGSSAC